MKVVKMKIGLWLFRWGFSLIVGNMDYQIILHEGGVTINSMNLKTGLVTVYYGW